MTNPTRNISSYTNPQLNVGVLLKEDGDPLLTEDEFEFLLENPSQDPSLTARNAATLGTNPSRN